MGITLCCSRDDLIWVANICAIELDSSGPHYGTGCLIKQQDGMEDCAHESNKETEFWVVTGAASALALSL